MIKNVAIFTADRAERGLLEPVYKELGNSGISAGFMQTTPGNVLTAMQETEHFCDVVQFEFAIVPCDRPEMVGVALWLFYHNKPFAQFHAGDVGSGTHDEVGRWIISRCASLHFCNSPESAYNLIKNGEEEWRVHFVGSTAFDGILPDMSVGPDFPFDLLLVHPDTFSAENTLADINKALGLLDKFTVIVGPNEDTNHEIIVQQLLNYHYRDGAQGYDFYASLPREKFLGMMAKCQRFITNSSSALYELPQFGIHKWVNIGLRNADRKPLTEIEPGASKKIAGIIKSLEIDDRLLRKKFT